jgi:hypothetical protein
MFTPFTGGYFQQLVNDRIDVEIVRGYRVIVDKFT